MQCVAEMVVGNFRFGFVNKNQMRNPPCACPLNRIKRAARYSGAPDNVIRRSERVCNSHVNRRSSAANLLQSNGTRFVTRLFGRSRHCITVWCGCARVTCVSRRTRSTSIINNHITRRRRRRRQRGTRWT